MSKNIREPYYMAVLTNIAKSRPGAALEMSHVFPIAPLNAR